MDADTGSAPTTMRALLIDAAETVAIREVPAPEPGPGQVRLRIRHVGICGSDLHYYADGANGAFAVREPLVPGHELSATVDQDPAGRWEPGTPVTVHPARFGDRDARFAEAPNLFAGGSYLGSASTWPHTQGALSELLVVEADMLRALPAGLSPRTAVLAEPLGVALHALTQARSVGAALDGARVLVAGAGPIGLLAVAAARDAGAVVDACDVREGPLERARAQGAEQVLRADREAPEAGAYDVVLECSAAPSSISAALQAVRPAGVVVQVGMVPPERQEIALAPLIAREVRLVGAFRFVDEIDDAVELLARRPQIGAVITHELDPERPEELFAAAGDSESSGKVIASWR
ncbi:L-idonate 5-dehydrogenase [Nesterenkonia halophila]|nr:zinc-binding dehydrogenase [Nesterenkonia halophila]